MIADVGKSPCGYTLPNGNLISFFNGTMLNKGTVVWYDTNDAQRYTMTLDADALAKQYRSLFYQRYALNGSLETISRIVPFLGNVVETTGSHLPVQPLFEIINPTINKVPGMFGMSLIYWSNIKADAVLLQDSNKAYKYDATKLYKLETNKLSEIEDNENATKILCSATVNFEMLKQKGAGIEDSQFILTPVVQSVSVLTLIAGQNYIVDFSVSSGGGLRRHSHINNGNGCGLSYSVFAPGSSLAPISWQ